MAELGTAAFLWIEHSYCLPDGCNLGPGTTGPEFFPASSQHFVTMLATSGDSAFCRGHYVAATLHQAEYPTGAATHHLHVLG